MALYSEFALESAKKIWIVKKKAFTLIRPLDSHLFESEVIKICHPLPVGSLHAKRYTNLVFNLTKIENNDVIYFGSATFGSKILVIWPHCVVNRIG
jgi:hypothetical protein